MTDSHSKRGIRKGAGQAHRLDHTEIFWPLHRFHHAAEDFCMVTAVRAQPVGLTTIISSIPMAILGASPWTIVAFSVVKNVVGFMSHSRVRKDFGWWGRWVFLAPVNHRLHHKLDISEPVGHFGVIPIWDRMFGTFTGKADADLTIGVAERYSRGSRFLVDLVRDYLDFWVALGRVVLRALRLRSA
jgi:sterol desaturase/sphingolipid hydroxylase (fatty acid hydroxylase superfamily)